MAVINEAAIAAALARHMPRATVIFITDSDGNRTVVAFTEPPEPVIADYRRRGYRVDSGEELKEVS
jgi:hypothetical protein